MDAEDARQNVDIMMATVLIKSIGFLMKNNLYSRDSNT